MVNDYKCLAIIITLMKMIMSNTYNNVNGMRKSFHLTSLLTILEGMRVILMRLCIINMYVPKH